MKEKKEKITKRTVRVNDVVEAFRSVNPAKLTKMETADRYALILATRQLKKVAGDFDELVKDAQEKLKPEGFDVIIDKLKKKEKLTPGEQTAVNEYDRQVSDCIGVELKREVILEFEPLGNAAIDRFIESNDFSIREIIIIHDVLGNA